MEQTSTRQITTAILFVIVSIVNTCGAIFLRSHLLLVKPSFVKPSVATTSKLRIRSYADDLSSKLPTIMPTITYDYADDLSSKLHFAGLHFAVLLLPTIYLQSCIYDFILLGCIMSIMLIFFSFEKLWIISNLCIMSIIFTSMHYSGVAGKVRRLVTISVQLGTELGIVKYMSIVNW